MTGINMSGIVTGAGVQLQQQVYNKFSSAVDQFTRQPLSSIFGGGDEDFLGQSQGGDWRPINYAEDLITYQPKHRFMFRVLFEMDPSFTDLIGGRKEIFQYVIKNIDRPKLNFEYEAVNMYNFKTKVLKTINHEPLTMTLIDDVQDTFHLFFRAYLQAHSPVARSWNPSQTVSQLEDGGFNFSDPRSSNADSAIRSVLADGKINPFLSIRLIQYYGHAGGQNTFWFVNPRILDISYDSAEHEGGDQGNHATIRFDYDALRIQSPEKSQGRSQYAAPGTDMFGPNLPGLNTGFQGTIFGNDDDGSLFGWLSSMGKGIVGNAISNVSGQVLNGISNPLLRGASRNIIYGATRQIGMTTSSTSMFGRSEQLGRKPSDGGINNQEISRNLNNTMFNPQSNSGRADPYSRALGDYQYASLTRSNSIPPVEES